MKSVQAAISQITVERNLASVFSNEQKSVAVADQNTEMTTETTDLFSRANSVLTETSDVEMKSINFDHNQNSKQQLLNADNTDHMKKKQRMSASEKQIDFHLCVLLINSV